MKQSGTKVDSWCVNLKTLAGNFRKLIVWREKMYAVVVVDGESVKYRLQAVKCTYINVIYVI